MSYFFLKIAFHVFRKMELFNFIFFLYFGQLNFLAWKLKKVFLYFRKSNFLKKILIFQERTFQVRKIKKNPLWKENSYISGKMELSSPKIKIFLYFRKIPSLKELLILFLIVLRNKFIIFFLLLLKINPYIFHHNILHENLHIRNY